MRNKVKSVITFQIITLLLLFGSDHTFAKDYSFSWTANPEPVEGYNLYYKKGGLTAETFEAIVADEGPFSVDVGKVTNHTISGLLDNATYHFALTAYSGNEESAYTEVITVFPEGGIEPLIAAVNVDQQSGDVPLTVTFDASGSTGSITGYSWDFGDSSKTVSGQSVSHTYNTPGNYTATLTVSDSEGQTSHSTYEIIVHETSPQGVSYSFSWAANPDPVEGYKLYYKKGGLTATTFEEIVAEEGPFSVDVGKATSHTVNGLSDKTTYHFALTAYNGSEESGYTKVITVFPVGSIEPLSAKVNVVSQTGVAPLTVSFDGSSSTGSISSYSWDYGDNSTPGSGSNVSHTYENSGSYTAVLIIEDGLGQSDEAGVSINVAEPLLAHISVGNQTGEAPFTVSFDGSSSTGSISSYSWDYGDNSAPGLGSSISHTYENSGSYTAVLTVEDGSGQSEKASVIINVVEPLSAKISVVSQTGEAPFTASFDGSGSTGSIASYSWEFGDDSDTVSGQSVVHIFNEPGSYTTTLTVRDSTGRISQDSSVIVVSAANEEVGYSFSWTGNPEPVEGYKLYYKKGGLTAPNFEEIVADEGPFSIELGKVTSYTISGLIDNTTYHFALTAYNGGEESEYTEVITVFPSGSVGPLEAIVNADRQTGEAPLSINFDGSASRGSISSYSWNFGDGDVAYTANANNIFSSAGIYTVTLTISDDSGASVQDSIVVNVSETAGEELPSPTANAKLVDFEGETPLVLKFNAGDSTCTPETSLVRFEWDFGDGIVKDGGEEVVHAYGQSGTYLVTLKVTDGNGSTDETTISVTLNETGVEENGDPIAVFTKSTTIGTVPLSVTFDASSSRDPDGDSFSYTWTFGDGASASGTIVEHVYSSTGVYEVVLALKDEHGATSVSTENISVLTEDEYKKHLRDKQTKLINIIIINSLLLGDNKPPQEIEESHVERQGVGDGKGF